MITVNFIGGARKSFQTDSLKITQNIDTISEMISHLISKKPENTPDFNGKNLLIAVNGVDSSALAGNNTHLKSGDVVNIIPIIHGGSKTNVTFTIKNKTIQLFEMKKYFLRNLPLSSLLLPPLTDKVNDPYSLLFQLIFQPQLPHLLNRQFSRKKKISRNGHNDWKHIRLIRNTNIVKLVSN